MKKALITLGLLSTLVLSGCGAANKEVGFEAFANIINEAEENGAQAKREEYNTVLAKGYWDNEQKDGSVVRDQVNTQYTVVWDEEGNIDFALSEEDEALIYEDEAAYESYIDSYLALMFFAFATVDEYEGVQGKFYEGSKTITAEFADNSGDLNTLTYAKDTLYLQHLVLKTSNNKGNVDLNFTWSK